MSYVEKSLSCEVHVNPSNIVNTDRSMMPIVVKDRPTLITGGALLVIFAMVGAETSPVKMNKAQPVVTTIAEM